MHLIVCPNCGKRMKTAVLMRGRILCPGCQVHFSALEPNHSVATLPVKEPKNGNVRLAIFSLFGLFWLFFFAITGGFAFIWEVSTGSISLSGWQLFILPLYLAQLSAAYYFLTPLLRRSFGRQPTAMTSPVASAMNGGPQSAQSQGIHPQKDIFNTLSSLSLVMFFFALLLAIGVVIFLFILVIAASGGGMY